METKKTQYILIKEGMIESIVKDIFSYGGLALLFWFNESYLNGVWVIEVIAFVVIMGHVIKALGGENKNFHKAETKKEAINIINSL